jgi:beta-phosphoglucomutase-like phosphatase (HAD superfamily)
MTCELRPGVLFDVDGTLVDTNYLHTVAWSCAPRGAGEWAPMNAIHRLIGLGGDQHVPELVGHDSPATVDARPRRYRELLEEVRAFPQAAELLRALHDRGVAVVLASSSPADELKVLREVLDADDAMAPTEGADQDDSSGRRRQNVCAQLEVGALDTFDPFRPGLVGARGRLQRPWWNTSTSSG